MAAVAMGAAIPNNKPVIMDLLSGPTGAPFERGKPGSGALSTGIGFGLNVVIGPGVPAIKAASFSDDYTPGVTKPDGTASADSTLMYIGGGRSNALGRATPYTAGFGIGAFGGGSSRDAGAGPNYTGFSLKTVTAPGAVALGAAVEAGFTNRSPVALTTGQTTFGSATAASAAVA